MPTSIHELLGRDITDEEIEEMARRASHDGQMTLGNICVLQREDMVSIYRMAR
jgi:alcohol dehydrogenase YqhD (iron-dependent ADH family)